ncbi:hypothetical protein BJX76DRAFT_351102 [Aspergillus varians]
MMLSHSILLLGLSCAGLVTATRSLKARQGPATAEKFKIYAYGEGISGLPVFYADARAQLGDPALSTAKVAQAVYFTISDSSSSAWLAHPSKTGSSSNSTGGRLPFKSAVLSLPSAGSSNSALQFHEPTASFLASDEANGFDYYGNFVLIDTENANFYAVPTDADGVYSLILSEVGSEQTPVILRTVASAAEELF